MTSRERVRCALNHKEPDKIPFSLGSNIVDGFTKFAADNFETFLGLPHEDCIITHKPMGTVVTPGAVQARYPADFVTIRLKAPWNNPSIVYGDGSYLDDYGCKMQPCEFYYDNVNRPLEGVITVDDIKKNTWPEPYASGRTEGLREEALRLRNTTDKALAADIMCGGPFEQALWMRGWEDFLADLYTDSYLADALMDKILEIDIGLWDVFLGEVGDLADVVCQGDDIAMQTGPILSPELYRKRVFKYHKQLYDFIKSKTKAKIFHHSCGGVYKLIPGLIEAGVDILNPVQTSAADMDPARLKREFGDSLSFWGALDTQKLLPYGSPQQVADEVKRLAEILGKDGGYIFAPGHNIQAMVPPENIKAMLDAVNCLRG
jgi:uroporphyrinogen decarboxylase